MTAFPGFRITAIVRGGQTGSGRRANPTQATARLCVGGASRRFRLRQSAPVDEGRQSQPPVGGGPGFAWEGLPAASASGSLARRATGGSPNPVGNDPGGRRVRLPAASASGSLARRATGGSPNPTRATAPADGG